MKFFIILAVVAFAAARPDAYEDLEKLNSEELVSNKRLLSTTIHCLIGDGKCSPQTKEIREVVPDAVLSTCEKCNPKQKKIVAQIIKAFMEQLPEEWNTLYNQYDPKEARKEELHNFLHENA